MLKVFLKDILDKKTVIKYMVLSVVLFLVTELYLGDKVAVREAVASRAILYIVAGLCYSVFFFVRTYIKNDRVLLYYALPVSKRVVNDNIVLSVLIDTLLRKMILAYAVLLGLQASCDVYIELLCLLPGIVILGCVPNVSDMSIFRKIFVAAESVLYCCGVYLLFGRMNIAMATAISIVLCLGGYVLLRWSFMDRAIFRLKIKRSFTKYSLSNYFFKFVMAENVYIINTVFVLAIVIAVSLFAPGFLSISLACAMGAVNTPLLTVFSTEKELNDMSNMLPATFKSLKKDYICILGVYFALVQALILVLHIPALNPKIMIGLLIATAIEVFGGFLLEEKYPIGNKKTASEVWKNPRKYVLPVVVFLVTFAIQAV